MKSSSVCFANASQNESWSNDGVKCFIDIWLDKYISEQLSKAHKNTAEALILAKKL